MNTDLRNRLEKNLAAISHEYSIKSDITRLLNRITPHIDVAMNNEILLWRLAWLESKYFNINKIDKLKYLIAAEEIIFKNQSFTKKIMEGILSWEEAISQRFKTDVYYLENYEEHKDLWSLEYLKNDSELKQMVQEVFRKMSEIEDGIKEWRMILRRLYPKDTFAVSEFINGKQNSVTFQVTDDLRQEDLRKLLRVEDEILVSVAEYFRGKDGKIFIDKLSNLIVAGFSSGMTWGDLLQESAGNKFWSWAVKPQEPWRKAPVLPENLYRILWRLNSLINS